MTRMTQNVYYVHLPTYLTMPVQWQASKHTQWCNSSQYNHTQAALHNYDTGNLAQEAAHIAIHISSTSVNAQTTHTQHTCNLYKYKDLLSIIWKQREN